VCVYCKQSLCFEVRWPQTMSLVLRRDVTITPRQRIQTYREITRIRALEGPTKEQKDR
jgi:hypothetical protein